MPGINFETIRNAIASFLGRSEDGDAIELLMEDHRRVKQLFDAYEEMDGDEKVQCVHKVLVELALHAAVEEKYIYPLLGDVGERDGMNESKEEHHVIKFLMSELETMHRADEFLDAKIKVLSEIVDHHVKEEELEYFPKLRGKSDINLKELGEQIAARKEELLGLLGDETDLSVIDPELGSRHSRGREVRVEAAEASISTTQPTKSKLVKKTALKKPEAKDPEAKDKVGAKDKLASKATPASKNSEKKKATSKTKTEARPSKKAVTSSKSKATKKTPVQPAGRKTSASRGSKLNSTQKKGTNTRRKGSRAA